jgi:hypothetical protein
MRIKLLYFFLIACCCFKHTYAQNINLVGAVSTTGRLAHCGSIPTVTVTRISGIGSHVTAGVLVCDDPCDTTILEFRFDNLQWEKDMPEATGPQTNEDNWIHGFYFPNSATISLLPYNPPLGNLGYVFANSCIGQCPAPTAGGTVGPAGVYFDNTSNASCCPGNPNNDGIPQNNWGDGLKACGVNFTFIFRARLCNNKITSSNILLRFRADSDGNTGCWLRRDDFFNSLTFFMSTSPCPHYSLPYQLQLHQ